LLLLHLSFFTIFTNSTAISSNALPALSTELFTPVKISTDSLPAFLTDSTAAANLPSNKLLNASPKYPAVFNNESNLSIKFSLIKVPNFSIYFCGFSNISLKKLTTSGVFLIKKLY
jgi:hypothetical protein